MFATIMDYLPLPSTNISPEDKEAIEDINREFDFENHPSFSSDLFVHNRPNSGGLLPQPGLQTKAATLKSIELLLPYVTRVAGTVASLFIRGIYQKLLTLGIVSYADNFITRAIATDSAQFEHGLANYLKGPEHPMLLLTYQNLHVSLQLVFFHTLLVNLSLNPASFPFSHLCSDSVSARYERVSPTFFPD